MLESYSDYRHFDLKSLSQKLPSCFADPIPVLVYRSYCTKEIEQISGFQNICNACPNDMA